MTTKTPEALAVLDYVETLLTRNSKDREILGKARNAFAAEHEMLATLLKCHAGGGFVLPDADVLDNAKASLAAVEELK